MKTKLFAVFSLLAVVAFATPGPAPRSGCGAGAAGGCVGLPPGTAPVVLSEGARAALGFQIDEERMARELYAAFGEKWGRRPFRHIVTAEARHEAALQALATRAGVAVAPATPGRFATAAVQARYDTLLAQGMKSSTDALRAGALLEEQDIADLRALAATTTGPELQQTVAALERASGHHLAAFVRSLNGEYAAQVLPAAEVAALANRSGRGGRPGGRGFCGGS